MTTVERLHTHRQPRRRLGQLIAGMVALPLSALPFVGYANFTPEGRLVRDRALVALRPPSLPSLTPAQAAAAAARAPRYKDAVMALAYHGIGSASDGEGGFAISAKRFGEHLATLRAAGMRAVTATDVATAFAGGRALPSNAVMITFDDGRTDAMLFADPLLAQAGMAATMFVITGAASKPGVYYASWEKLKSYARSGRWDLQSHTTALHREQKVAGGKSLPALTSLAPGESPDAYRSRVRADLGRAGSAIERHVGRRPVAFAYPFGAYGAERTNHPAIRKILRQEVSRRYAVAFHQDDQESVPLLSGNEDRLGLRRLEVEDWSGPELLRRIRRAAEAAARASRVTPEPNIPPTPVVEPSASPLAAPPPAPAPAPAPSVRSAASTVPRAVTRTRRTTVTTAPAVTATPAVTAAPVPSTGAPAPTASPTTPPPPAPPGTAPPPAVTSTSSTTVPPTTEPPSPGCRSHGKGPKVCSS